MGTLSAKPPSHPGLLEFYGYCNGDPGHQEESSLEEDREEYIVFCYDPSPPWSPKEISKLHLQEKCAQSLIPVT